MTSTVAKPVLSALDLLLGAAVLAGAILPILATRRRRRPRGRALVVFNTSYSVRVLRYRKAEHFITHSDLGGYFDHVWTVHPVVGADPDDPEESSVGGPTVTTLAQRHTMIEGRVARTARLSRLPMLNFALAQVELMFRVSRLIAREGVGTIEAWEPFYTGPLALALGKLHGVPVQIQIVSNYDDIYNSVGDLAYPRLLRWRRLEQAVARFTLSRVDQIVVLSADNLRYALANGATEDRTACVGNWSLIDPVHRTDPRDRAAFTDEFGFGGRPFAVTVTRLERVKFPGDVLTVLARAREQIPELAGLIIGDGSMRGELEELARDLGLEDHVVFVGSRNHRWMSEALAAATVVLAPMAGLTLTEAALSATPVIAYDYEWHAEFIDTDETGILVPHRDTDAMAAAACALVADPQRARRLGDAARSRALERTRPEALLAHERALAERLLSQVG